jgi:glyoxylase-like metal-dependent hydrolase (beta-lactamase superfamily II)
MMPDVMTPEVRTILAPNPSALTGPGTNTYLVGSGGSVAVIDPGPAIDSHLAAILDATAAQKISHIFVTHPHRDHSALARPLAQATGALVLAYGSPGSGRSPLMQGLAELGDIGGGEGSDTGFAPDQLLTHGQRIHGEGWSLEVLHTPGHMSEHLCLAQGDVLFSGDHVMAWSTSLVSPPDGDMGAYMASLALLAARRWHQFLPGHGAPVLDPATRLAELARHRLAREAAILTALQQGPATLDKITRTVYAETPAHLHPAAARNAFAHLVDLTDKGRILADPALTPKASFRLA